MAVGYFPAGELEKALAMWPALLAGWDVHSHLDYCHAFDAHLRGLDLPPGTRILLAPIEVKHFVRWCMNEGMDPAAPASRSRYATTIATRGRVQPWPPAPSDSCWCGSEKPYEECCGPG